MNMNGQDRPNRVGDVRLTLFANVFFTDHSDNSLRVVLLFLQSQSPGHIAVFGVAQGVVTSTTRNNIQVALALHRLIQSQFHMDITEVNTIRLGRGVSSYPKMNTSPRSCVIFGIPKIQMTFKSST